MRRLHWVTLVLTAIVGAAGCEDSADLGFTGTVDSLPSAASLSVTPSNAVIEIGKSVKLRATVQRTDGTRLAPKSLRWTSSDRKVATIATDGSVQGVRAGRVKIDARWGNQHGSAFVTVAGPSVGTPADCHRPGRPPCN